MQAQNTNTKPTRQDLLDARGGRLGIRPEHGGGQCLRRL